MMLMARTTVDVDVAALAAAQAALGTHGLSATVNTALREVARRSALSDFDVRRDVDGTPGEVESGRKARGGAKAD
jgi:Arc/MetJ family transcription regulator